MKRFSNCIGLLAWVGISMIFGGLSMRAQAADPKIRVVRCEDPVQSTKRGICVNKFSADDFRAVAPGVSWYYNWHYETKDLPPAGVEMEFLPMAWGDTPERLSGLERYLSNHKPRAVLAINEPNLKGQAFIPPEQTAKLYLKIKAIADKHKIPVVGPHMALGSSNKDSISADDPIENKKVTYTFMVPFLKAFMHYVGDNDQVGALGVHGYGHLGEFNWAANLLQKEFNKPVWVTEYAWWGAPNDAEELKFLVQSTDLMERTPTVQGYAWFKERVGGNKKISLFEKESGKLTKLGQAYVAMPVHAADLFYRVPGNLSAGRYVTMSEMQINPTDAPGGFVDMTSQKSGGWCDYNVQAEAAGAYTVSIRTKGDGEVAILKSGKTLATEKMSGKDWQTLTAKVQLTKGPQTLRIGCTQKGQVIESIEFAKP